MVASAASTMPTSSRRDTAGRRRPGPQSVRGGAGSDGGLRGGRVVGCQHEAVATSATTLDHDDDHAVAAVGQHGSLHGRHLFEFGPAAVPDRLAVGLVQCEARVEEGEGQVRDGHLALRSLRQEVDVGHGPRLLHTSRRRYCQWPHERGIGVGHVVGEEGRLPADHPQDGGVDGRDGPERLGRYASTQGERPPGSPRRRQHGGGRRRGPLACHLPLDDQIGAAQAAVPVVEQVAQQGRGGAEGERAHHSEGAAGHPVAQRVAADDPDVRHALSPHLAAQVLRPVRIAFERNDLDAAPGEREGAGAAPRADLDHEVTGLEGRLGDQRGGEVRPEEVLTETAPSLVPWRPLGRGHGTSPCIP